jgi:hypothetical protein
VDDVSVALCQPCGGLIPRQLYGSGTGGLKLSDAVEFFGVLSEDTSGAYSDATGTSEATVTSAFVGGGLSDGLEATTYSRTTKLHCIGEHCEFPPVHL